MDLTDFARSINGRDLMNSFHKIADSLVRIATVLESLDAKTRPHVPPAPVEAPEASTEPQLANGDEGW